MRQRAPAQGEAGQKAHEDHEKPVHAPLIADLLRN
jgi:hypothetical protein